MSRNSAALPDAVTYGWVHCGEVPLQQRDQAVQGQGRSTRPRDRRAAWPGNRTAIGGGCSPVGGGGGVGFTQCGVVVITALVVPYAC